jgi:hypothetical protein
MVVSPRYAREQCNGIFEVLPKNPYLIKRRTEGHNPVP